MKRTILLASAMAVVLVTASGCSGFRQAMGGEKEPPDEYTVVENAPLTLPPDFGLRPPRSPDTRPATPSTQQQAEQTVFSSGVSPGGSGPDTGTSNLSPGESALLSQAGAGNVSPGIRSQIEQDETSSAKTDQGLIHRLLYRGRTKPEDQTLDPVKESARIQADMTAGKPVTSGSAPAIQRTSHTLFDAL
jgi:hypothetical protein